MKTLVAYYSRTGTTRKVAQDLARELGCDVEEIVDRKNRSGPIGYLMGGRDAMTKRLTDITEPAHDCGAYDLVVVCSPNWGANMTPAVRTYITKYRASIKDVAFLCTQGGRGGERVLKGMAELSGKSPRAKIILSTAEVMNGSHLARLKEFSKALSG